MGSILDADPDLAAVEASSTPVPIKEVTLASNVDVPLSDAVDEVRIAQDDGRQVVVYQVAVPDGTTPTDELRASADRLRAEGWSVEPGTADGVVRFTGFGYVGTLTMDDSGGEVVLLEQRDE